MSFGFSVGDFLAAGQLALTLYTACKGAPGELGELARELNSIHTLLADLEHQSQDPNSLLRRNCSDRREAWLQIRQNLEATLAELQDLVNKYRSMGKNA